ncbi:unnamed protein product [Euphydryas editha]|uniref:Uncharacterized protein n=1 Tax=Euphydryas editha TaxID=104508 RepID=A0AAU9TG10_EUPED|nr:unnamed protein product [Euphydryas editha]
MGEGTSPGVFFAASSNGNGYRLSARGVATLQTFLREHGADCVRQFMEHTLHSKLGNVTSTEWTDTGNSGVMMWSTSKELLRCEVLWVAGFSSTWVS